jgi:hypothetical protein
MDDPLIGQKLIAHELTHVIQQGAAVKQIKKADGDLKDI